MRMRLLSPCSSHGLEVGESESDDLTSTHPSDTPPYNQHRPLCLVAMLFDRNRGGDRNHHDQGQPLYRRRSILNGHEDSVQVLAINERGTLLASGGTLSEFCRILLLYLTQL